MAVNRWLSKVGWNVHQVARVSSGAHFGHLVQDAAEMVAGRDVSHDENKKVFLVNFLLLLIVKC
jgi:hypothetical protein